MSMHRNYAVRISVHDVSTGQLFAYINLGEELTRDFFPNYVSFIRVGDTLRFVQKAQSAGKNNGVYKLDPVRKRIQVTGLNDVELLLDFVGQYTNYYIESQPGSPLCVDKKDVTGYDNSLPSKKGIPHTYSKRNKKQPVVFSEPCTEPTYGDLVNTLKCKIWNMEGATNKLMEQKDVLLEQVVKLETKINKNLDDLNAYRKALEVAMEEEDE